SLHERVGVQSFARQDAAFFGERRPPDWKLLLLRRATWTVVHEISHMFGLTHCVYWECIIAGSNNQAEADRRPLHECPVCSRKLHFPTDFDPAKRQSELAAVLHKLGIDDEAAWAEHPLAWIGAAVGSTRGKYTWNVVPRPTSESTAIAPPLCWTIPNTVERPRPEP